MRLSRHTAALALSLLLSIVPLAAQNTSAQQSRKEQLEKEIALLQKQISDSDKKRSNALNTLTLTRKQISIRKDLLEQSRRELKSINDSISATQASIRRAQTQLDTLSHYYERLIRRAYTSRDASTWYAFILSSSDLAQASRRYGYLKSLSGQMRTQASKIKQLRSELSEQLLQLNTLKASATKLQKSRQSELSKLQADEKRSNSLISELKRNKTNYQKQLKTKRNQVEKLNAEIEKIISDYIAQSQKGSSSSKKAVPVDTKLAAEFQANKGKLPWPASGPIVERFGRHRHPVYTSIEMPFSNGIGIALSKGAKVQAVFGGEVKRIIVMPGYNKCVLVQHGSYFTFYCKLSDVSVRVGDKVATGQTIGTVDTIDSHTQLHFQVWKEKTPQDPELWLRKR